MIDQNATILVVDDNRINLKLVSDLLSFEGYHVHKAADGEAAQQQIESHPPDLVLLDLDLPGIDGLTLTQRIKSNPQTAHIMVVAVTAFAMKGDRQRAEAAGCDGYITKPIDTRQLPIQVAEWLRHKRPEHNLNTRTEDNH
jgi:CheY-like chemotaxis protein